MRCSSSWLSYCSVKCGLLLPCSGLRLRMFLGSSISGASCTAKRWMNSTKHLEGFNHHRDVSPHGIIRRGGVPPTFLFYLHVLFVSSFYLLTCLHKKSSSSSLIIFVLLVPVLFLCRLPHYTH